MAKMQIEIHTGHASPWSNQFDQDEITIGRADDADVRLHPTKDTACTRGIHARIVRDDDDWVLVVDHDSGVRIVDERGKVLRSCTQGEKFPLAGETYFELGNGGPRLSASAVGAGLPVTDRRVHGGNVPLPVGRVSGDVVKKANTAPKLIAGTVVLILLVGMGMAYWIIDVRHRGQTEVTTLGGQVRAETEEIRRRTEEGLGELREAVAQRSELTEAQLAILESSVTELREQPSDRMYEVLVEASKSVWLTGLYDVNTGGFRGGGTAWTVRDGVLATNAHVAEALLEEMNLAAGIIPVVRREGRPDQQVVLSTRMVIHPGYERWATRFSHQFDWVPGGGADLVSHVSPYDVALLYPEAEDTDLGRPLPLASNIRSRSLDSINVGYAGFPSENITGQPTLHRVSGRVSTQTDYFYRTTDELDHHLIHYTAPTVGGASGSPMFDESGEVIGLVSAGSNIFVEGRRAPVGFNYAQRVDVLMELLVDVADTRQDERDVIIERVLRTERITPEEFVDVLAKDLVGDRAHEFTDYEMTISDVGFQNGETLDLTLSPGRHYIFAVISQDWQDVNLAAFQGGTLVLRNINPLWFASAELGAEAAERQISLTVFTLANIHNPPSTAVLRVISFPALRPPAELFGQ